MLASQTPTQVFALVKHVNLIHALINKASISFAWRKDVRYEEFVHGEHMDSILFEDRFQTVIAADDSPVARILKFVLFDICPYFLHHLWTR